MARHPGDLPARPGHGLVGVAAFVDATPLRRRRPGFSGWNGHPPAEVLVDIGRRWVSLGDAVCTDLYQAAGGVCRQCSVAGRCVLSG